MSFLLCFTVTVRVLEDDKVKQIAMFKSVFDNDICQDVSADETVHFIMNSG